MKKSLFLSSLMLVSIASVYASPDEFKKGVTVTKKNMFELVQTSLPLSVARSGQRLHDDPFVSAFLHNEPASLVYSLSGNNYLYATKYPDRELLDRWPLTRWEHEYLPEKVIHRYEDHRLSVFDTESPFSLAWNTTFGCLPEIPLRYGDVFGGEREDLVLWLGYDFVIFSPEQGETLFTQRMSMDDWLDREATDKFMQWVPGGLQVDQPQYQSRIIAETTANYQAPIPGFRGYAKLYFGSFSAENSHDILVWHKLYESRRESDDIQGFRKLEEVYRHVELQENGNGDAEFVLQETDSETIQGWLSSNNLRWPDGYPRLSECPGEEGELIAEMHDPLLNDQDVLPEQ